MTVISRTRLSKYLKHVGVKNTSRTYFFSASACRYNSFRKVSAYMKLFTWFKIYVFREL